MLSYVHILTSPYIFNMMLLLSLVFFYTSPVEKFLNQLYRLPINNAKCTDINYIKIHGNSYLNNLNTPQLLPKDHLSRNVSAFVHFPIYA